MTDSDDQNTAEDARGGGNGDPGTGDGPSSGDRRAVLKKAAVGFGVAGAAWVAPKIEGLSMKPNYAAAGTVSGSFTFRRDSVACPNPFASAATDCWGACRCNPVTVNHTIQGEPISINWAGNADSNGTGTATANFTAMDPPFNSNCRITGANGNGSLGSHRTNSVNPTQIQWDTTNLAGQGNDVTITIVC